MEQLKELFESFSEVFVNESERPYVSTMDEEQFLKDTSDV